MKWLRSCIAAFRFLTIFPLPGTYGSAGEDLAGAIFFFPLVGLCLGLIAAGSAWLLWGLFPSPVGGVILTALLFSFSGALHLDGLADTADGFFSARERSKILEIMRDSRIGVMGVAALLIVLLIKVTAFSAFDRTTVVRAAFIMPFAGRCSLVIMMALLAYVRREGGLGTQFYSRNAVWAAVTSMIILIILCFVLMNLQGLVLACWVIMAILLFSWLCRRKIGGATGDTLGAVCELSETVVVLFLAGGQ